MLLNSVGMMGENVALGWLVLELTNSPLLVGVAMGTRALPLFFAGVPAGALADRWPRHHLLVATGVGQGLTAPSTRPARSAVSSAFWSPRCVGPFTAPVRCSWPSC